MFFKQNKKGVAKTETMIIRTYMWEHGKKKECIALGDRFKNWIGYHNDGLEINTKKGK